jgi:hypothetical protein
MKPTSNRYVFILGFSRTGSTMLQHILNKYTDIGIIPEMHIYWPKMLHKDFSSIFKERYGKTIKTDEIDDLINLMYSKTIQGLFWMNINQYNIDVKELKNNILESERTIKCIIDALIVNLKKNYGKKIMGAKFPVHFSFANVLIGWYPECKLIHTIRDPRAIFVSQYHKYKSDSNSLKNILIGLIQFIHVNLSIKKVYIFHKRYKNNKNYHIFKYEDVLSDPNLSFKSLCEFLEIPFNIDMLKPEIFNNSSLSRRGESVGIQKSSMKLWEKRIPKSLSTILKILNTAYMKEFGYL